ncbi:MAG TPA: glycoside hydrolase family 30 beta sandwich domain-containing protein, partial [Gemmatimonadaceae bacterium]|nr:glycoside hydrolase family 30 beta sandwich domain-containing protein [Gemmatimonadaceae bacterium]
LYGVPMSTMADMAVVASQYGLPLWMSEWSVSDGRPIGWASVVHEMIAEHDVSAVDYMWGFFGAQNQSSLVLVDHTGKRFTGARIASSGHAMAQYARYVRPGARRVSVVSSNSSVKVTAFIKDGKVTIVAINRLATPVTTRISIAGVSGLARLSLIRSGGADKLKGVGRFDVKDNVLNVELPPETVSTLVQY